MGYRSLQEYADNYNDRIVEFEGFEAYSVTNCLSMICSVRSFLYFEASKVYSNFYIFSPS